MTEPTLEDRVAALEASTQQLRDSLLNARERFRVLRNRVGSIVVCPQCGQPISSGSCGPDHAQKAARLADHFDPPVVE